ncbi:hypothetical protein F5I97DRAFT_731352 [Phlebopus sp. FC_14]|nr:hypothetical protein F5I97DRAFT_731352 [Phlebopus sp. FC_14]
MSQQSVEERSSDGPRKAGRTRSCGDSEYCARILRPDMKTLLHRQASLPPFMSRRVPQRTRADLPLSPMSAYSFTSLSGSSNTQEQPSPRTPEFGQSPSTIIARPNETPITAFLSQFYDADSSPHGAHLRQSAREARGLEFYGDIQTEGKSMEQLPTAECKILRIPDVPSPVLPEDPSIVDPFSRDLERNPTHPPLPDARKARRFAGEFVCAGLQPIPQPGEQADKPDISQSSAASHTLVVASTEGKLSPVGHDPSALSSGLPFPHQGISRPGPLSESETKAVQEFLKQWGSRQRPLRDRKHREDAPPPPTCRGNASQGPMQHRDASSDEFSWEAKDSEDEDSSGHEHTTRCSTLLHEASLMFPTSCVWKLLIITFPLHSARWFDVLRVTQSRRRPVHRKP